MLLFVCQTSLGLGRAIHDALSLKKPVRVRRTMTLAAKSTLTSMIGCARSVASLAASRSVACATRA
jgi:hypothetical protein